MRVATKCLLSWPFEARVQKERATLLGGGIKSSSSRKSRVKISQMRSPASIEMAPRTNSLLSCRRGNSQRRRVRDRTEMSVCKMSPGLFVQFRIGALIGARVNLGINRETAGPSLDHEINRNETLEQRNRQLNPGIGTFRIVTDGDLIAP